MYLNADKYNMYIYSSRITKIMNVKFVIKNTIFLFVSLNYILYLQSDSKSLLQQFLDYL